VSIETFPKVYGQVYEKLKSISLHMTCRSLIVTAEQMLFAPASSLYALQTGAFFFLPENILDKYDITPDNYTVVR
jgi:hypothetical protein